MNSTHNDMWTDNTTPEPIDVPNWAPSQIASVVVIILTIYFGPLLLLFGERIFGCLVLYQCIVLAGFESWLHSFNGQKIDEAHQIPFSEMQLFELQHVLVFGVVLAVVVVRHRRVQLLFLGGCIGRVLANLVLAFVLPAFRASAKCKRSVNAPVPGYPFGGWVECDPGKQMGEVNREDKTQFNHRPK